MSLFLISLLFLLGHAAHATNYTQNGYTLVLVDKSNGVLSATTIQNQVNMFFSMYPGMAAGYVGAPTTITLTLDPAVAQNTIAISGVGLSLSVANLQANGNDTGYMNFGLSNVLSNFYSPVSTSTTSTSTTTTTTKPPTTTTVSIGSNTYTQNGYTLILVNKSNGTLSAATIQNQVNMFFSMYPGMAAGYANAPTTVTITLDTAVASNSVAVSNTGISLSAASLQSNGNNTSYMQFGLNFMLSNFYSTQAPGSTSTTKAATTIVTTTSTQASTTKASTETTSTGTTPSSPTLATSAPNTWTCNGYIFKINDKSNGQVPSSTLQNQARIFCAIYPGLASQYTNAPTSVTLNIDPAISNYGTSAGTGSFSLSSSHLLNQPNDGGYMQYGINFMLSSFYTPKQPITTPPNPSAGYSIMTDSYRQVALDVHNKYRSTVALGNAVNKDGTLLPKASNMYKMTWSKQVEADAQAWANQCNWQHYMPSGSNEGQNMYRSGYVEDPADSLIEATNAFYAELYQYGINKTTLSTYSSIGHFTQLAWSNSNELGCGIANCSRMANVADTDYHTFVVCNYRSQGNVGSLPIYTPGNPASNCTQIANSVADSSSGLCVVQNLATIH